MKLVEQYSKILMPPHMRLHQLRREMENPYLVCSTAQCHICASNYMYMCGYTASHYSTLHCYVRPDEN